MLARSAAVRRFARIDAVRLVIATLLMVAALGSVLAIDALPGPFAGPGAIVGDVATVDIVAPRALRYDSDELTRLARDEAREQVGPQYDYSPERGQLTAIQQINALEEILSPVDAAFAAVLTPEARQVALRSAIPSLSPAAQETLAALEPFGWTSLKAELLRVLEAVERQEVRGTLLADVRDSIPERMSVRFGADERALAAEILSPLVVANSTFDETATEQARTEAANLVAPTSVDLSRGEIIVRRGDRVDDIAREKLDKFGLLNPRPDAVRAGGWFLLALLSVVLLLAWIWRFRSQIWHRSSALLLIALVLIGASVALKVTGDRSVLPYVVPVAAVGLLLAVLLDAGAAVMVTGVVALLGGAIIGSVEFAAYVFFGGIAGIIAVRRGEKLSQFVQAAVAIALVQIAVVTLFTLLGDRDFAGFFELAGAATASAAGAAIAALGSFVILGNAFGITTSFRLLELANPSQPLLRRLLLETPGTYHHSLMVGNLAERAAEAIGADPLLARVAAYYHDVGKLSNPAAFIENQAANDNIHDVLEPDQSVALLKAHVANGIDLAYEYKLPKPLIAFIPQHHGTATMSYFYGRAQEQAVANAGALPGTAAAKEAAATVDANRFRHAGPKPQSKEAAILMLADSVEASVRSLGTPDESTIRAMVSRIIRERLEDGQFDECDLTLRDLDRIREAFVAQLLGMYHRRIEYPQNKIVEIESRRAAGGSA
ncbi:MAG: HD family phosphohydrolase [Candidatus Limnocylindrales bacterium]